MLFPKANSGVDNARDRWHRPLGGATAAVFLLSSLFPIAAGLLKHTEAFPKWWGVADVSVAFLLAILAFALTVLAGGKITRQATAAAYRAYRVLINAILALIVVFFLAGDRITWINCLLGLAWRYWLLLYSLPAWFAVWNHAPAGLPPENAT